MQILDPVLPKIEPRRCRQFEIILPEIRPVPEQVVSTRTESPVVKTNTVEVKENKTVLHNTYGVKSGTSSETAKSQTVRPKEGSTETKPIQQERSVAAGTESLAVKTNTVEDKDNKTVLSNLYSTNQATSFEPAQGYILQEDDFVEESVQQSDSKPFRVDEYDPDLIYRTKVGEEFKFSQVITYWQDCITYEDDFTEFVIRNMELTEEDLAAFNKIVVAYQNQQGQTQGSGQNNSKSKGKKKTLW